LADHASALKRARQNELRRLRNRMTKTRLKHVVKTAREEAAASDTPTMHARLNEAKSVIDKAAKKGAIHKKTAARKISRLTKLVNKHKA
jgi:small subunit ribosomal protein S20